MNSCQLSVGSCQARSPDHAWRRDGACSRPAPLAPVRLSTQKFRHKSAAPRGFTLIEVLTAVAIISILVSMLVIGIRVVQRNSRTTATKVDLNNLAALLTELDVATKLGTQPSVWYWPPSITLPPTPAPAAWASGTSYSVGDKVTYSGGYYSAIQAHTSAAANAPGTTAYWSRLDYWRTPYYDVPLPAPGSVLPDASDRTMHAAIYNTAIAIDQMKAMPNNAKSLGQLPADRFMTVTLPSTATGRTTLDAWGNPIIFVASNGLAVRIYQDSSTGVLYRVTSVGMVKDANNDGDLLDANEGPASTARPFFASAGADGDFSKGDDNVYSFEN